ncbi:MAG: methyltransferase domain-containing protein [Chloroflexota bacterium]
MTSGQEKPSFLGPQYASAFEDPTVVASYHTRPPYPEAVFDIVERLLQECPGAVLDLGCGPGNIARRLVGDPSLAGLVKRVDALDVSPAMIAAGRQSPDGDHPRLRWLLGRAEAAPLSPPYALVTAAASLHWMDWPVVLPRLCDALLPAGRLLIVVDDALPPPWHHELIPILKRYSTNQEFRPGFDLVAALQERGLLDLERRLRTEPVVFRQPVAAYVESFHARSGFSRSRMTPEALAAFDAAVHSLVSRHDVETVELQVVAHVAWGRPLRPDDGA